jgi:hypothetical protein
MIRVFEIFCKLSLIKFSAQEMFEDTMLGFSKGNLSHLVYPCPLCGAKHPHWSFYANYERYLISFEHGATVTYRISVTRLICSSCGHTHAILPEIIIPYGSYSLVFILTVLRDYYLSQMTVQALCDKFQIAHSTLYAWKRLLTLHKKLWLGLLRDLSTKPLDFLALLPSLTTSDDLFLFYRLHATSFLQGVSKTARFSSA